MAGQPSPSSVVPHERQSTAFPGWETLRIRWLISHSSPTSRTWTREATLRNVREIASPYVALPDEEFRANLHVIFQNGIELPILPRKVIVDVLRKSGVSEELERASRIESGLEFYPVVLLPPGEQVPQNHIILLRYTYTDTDKANERVRDLLSAFFNIPSYHVAEEFTGREEYTTHIVVSAPDGFDLSRAPVRFFKDDPEKVPCQDPERAPPGLWETRKDARAVFHLAVPQGTRAFLDTSYEVRPEKEEVRLFVASFVLATLASVVALSIVRGSFDSVASLSSIVKWIQDHHFAVGSALFALVIVYLGLVTNPLTHRTKFWMLGPLFLSALVAALSPV